MKTQEIAMLWFDNNTKSTLSEKINKAATYYQEKYGELATICYVHPTMMGNDEKCDGIDIRSARFVLPNHFLVTRDENENELQSNSKKRSS